MTDGAAPATLLELVDSCARRGEAPAVVSFSADGQHVLSYAALAREVHRVAAGLRARDIGPGRTVLLWAGNCPEWIIAYFGIVCSGAAAVPLDNQAPVQQAAAVLEHARPALLLTTTAHVEELARSGSLTASKYLLLDAADDGERDWRRLLGAEAALPSVDAHSMASLLYTSGTTGTPKGVPLTHANLTSNLEALLEARLIRRGDRVLMPLPLHHTYPFTVGLLTVLGTGAVLILPSGLSGPEIARAAVEGRATVLLAVPRLCTALWESILAGARAHGPAAAKLFLALLGASARLRGATGLNLGRILFHSVHRRLGGRLRLIGCGGAKLEPDLEQKLEGLGLEVLTGYGLTETSPVLTFNRPFDRKLGSEGKPVPGVELRIEAIDGQPHGEINARGPNVFEGYWSNPAQTQAAFSEDGWFRTGDLGWIDSDGFLHVSGRSKEVIVLPDGKNVFPEEVEKIYARCPLLRELAVMEHENGLAALIVPDDDALRRRGALREAALLREELEDLAPHLAPYQRVSAFRITREPLPRTQLGKLKRHLLPALYAQAAAGEAGPATRAARPEDEHLLASDPTAAVWRWLGERFPAHELTFDTSPQLDLQIDSLEWVTLTLELEQRFGVVLSGEAVSRVMTLRDLLREVEAAPPAQEARSPEQAAARAGEPPGPLLRVFGAALFAVASLLMRAVFRLRASGLEQLPAEGPLVIAPNHTSYLDPLAVAAALPRPRLRGTFWAGWVGIMYAGPLSRLVSRATRVFPVDPDRDLAGAIQAARALLERGHAVIWFPEGRRSPTGDLQTFLPGIGLLLEETGARVVPAAIRGTFAAWPKHRRAPKLAAVSVTFGSPRSAEELRAAGEGTTNAERVASGLRKEVAALLLGPDPRPIHHVSGGHHERADRSSH